MHFYFDIDETILFLEDVDGNGKSNVDVVLNQIPRTLAKFNPYSRFEEHRDRDQCYVLNKDKMQKIFRTILEQGHTIDFITAGQLATEDMRIFFEKEFGITLDTSCICYNRFNVDPEYYAKHVDQSLDKTICLSKIAAAKGLKRSDMCLVDDCLSNIYPAKYRRFGVIHVDSGNLEISNGTRYIAALEKLLKIEKEKTIEIKTVDLGEHRPQASYGSMLTNSEENTLSYTGRKSCCRFFTPKVGFNLPNPINYFRRLSSQ